MAKAARKVNGDIVVYANTIIPVKSEDWLWDYEVKDMNCYARRMQEMYGF